MYVIHKGERFGCIVLRSCNASQQSWDISFPSHSPFFGNVCMCICLCDYLTYLRVVHLSIFYPSIYLSLPFSWYISPISLIIMIYVPTGELRQTVDVRGRRQHSRGLLQHPRPHSRLEDVERRRPDNRILSFFLSVSMFCWQQWHKDKAHLWSVFSFIFGSLRHRNGLLLTG